MAEHVVAVPVSRGPLCGLVRASQTAVMLLLLLKTSRHLFKLVILVCQKTTCEYNDDQ